MGEKKFLKIGQKDGGVWEKNKEFLEKNEDNKNLVFFTLINFDFLNKAFSFIFLISQLLLEDKIIK